MDSRLCWERDHWGIKASWTRRGSFKAGAGIYNGSGKCRIDDKRAWKIFQERMVAIRESLSDVASSDDGEDGEDDDDEETEQGQLNEDDEPGWVMGTITKTVQQHMKRFRQKQMKLDELNQPGWENAAD